MVTYGHYRSQGYRPDVEPLNIMNQNTAALLRPLPHAPFTDFWEEEKDLVLNLTDRMHKKYPLKFVERGAWLAEQPRRSADSCPSKVDLHLLDGVKHRFIALSGRPDAVRTVQAV